MKASVDMLILLSTTNARGGNYTLFAALTHRTTAAHALGLVLYSAFFHSEVFTYWYTYIYSPT